MNYHQQGLDLRRTAREAIAHAREVTTLAKLLRDETQSRIQEAKIVLEDLRALRHQRSQNGEDYTPKEE